MNVQIISNPIYSTSKKPNFGSYLVTDPRAIRGSAIYNPEILCNIFQIPHLKSIKYKKHGSKGVVLKNRAKDNKIVAKHLSNLGLKFKRLTSKDTKIQLQNR